MGLAPLVQAIGLDQVPEFCLPGGSSALPASDHRRCGRRDGHLPSGELSLSRVLFKLGICNRPY